MDQKLISKRLESIENELHNLRNIFVIKSKKNIVSLNGILKNINVDEKEIINAKKSLFKSL